MVLPESAIHTVSPNSAPLGSFFVEVCRTYLEAPMFELADGCVLYDPLAVAVAADSSIASYEEMAVGVETEGKLTVGQTVPLRE
jgi:inosine-uridine nucleoside N-ribohydrolase